jgi:hypothetical protein
VLLRIADAIEANGEELALLESLDGENFTELKSVFIRL